MKAVSQFREGEVKEYQSPKGVSPTARAVLLSGILMSSVVFSGCATFPTGNGRALQDEIDEIISTPPLDQVNWGIRVVDPERGQILYSRHAHLKFVPASNMKILSTATALSVLGPDFRYETDLYGVGSFEDGRRVLNGDLLLRASGDPTLSERFFPSADAPLDSLAQGLWDAGIRTVTGALVVDVSTWDSTSVPGSWMVQNLSGTSGATGAAFSIAEGVLTVEVTAGREEGAPARARWWPSPGGDFISVGFVTVHPDSSARGRTIQYLPESRHLKIEGQIQAGRVDTIQVSQRDPVRFAVAALARALERRGIEVQGGSRVAWDMGEPVGPGECTAGKTVADSMPPGSTPNPPAVPVPNCSDATRITGLTSAPMAEIVKAILEPSQNWMTEQLVRTIGAERGKRGSWREGFRVEQDFLTQVVGVDSLDISYQDGSGLSAYNLVTPRAMVRILEFMRASSNSGAFRNALASPGEEGSTLRSRLPELKSRVFAKTGTITHVNSLSGYVFTNSGRELIFSIFTNGSGLPSGDVRPGIDQITEAIARH
ncbi:MAG: D-alanyl-D-alanine carboxypeptidase/D-alanyl-D-alanine-endopeptidase [Longimicrobiales bacterium]|nr:D-alanyl-D-alanine carboxypeptidase/D-alanyl-D-alanine-endopeptidase [Longimicrobiales bacterium]